MRNCFRITPSRDSKGNLYLENGLIVFRLGVWSNGKEVDSVAINTGGRGRQEEVNLKTFGSPNSRPGSMEPIPEGQYAVGPADFKIPNSYSGNWGAGLGPVWFDLSPLQKGNRSEFGIHLDANRSFAPGSAGCPVATSLTDLKKIVELAKKYKIDLLVVDYGLGTVDKPITENKAKVEAKPTPQTFKMFINDNGVVVVIDDIEYEVFSSGKGWEGKLVKRK